MKKLIKVVSALTMAALFTAACAQPAPPAAPPVQPTDAPAPTAQEAPAAEEPAPTDGLDASDVQIALVAHSPESILDDGSFNEGAWQGIQRFLSNHGLPSSHANFFLPHAADDVARIDLIADAIGAGANILILPGFHFENALYEAQDIFPDTKFVLLDASPRRDGVARIESNVAAIHYAEEEAGFLAGYAAVMEGYRSLGFMGGIAVPAVVRYGHGFIQGAEYAAASLGLDAGEVTISYHYLGGFAPDPAHATMASAWFAAGTEVIFAAAGGAGFSVKSGAEGAGGTVIGVDVDQAGASPTVITSAMKALDVSVYDLLTHFMEGNFLGGGELRYNAAINGVGLPMESSRFQAFTQEQYENIFNQLASGAISVSSSLDMGDLDVSLVTVNEM
ncbi:MAG: BMP family ABC transporter substrate-binding protein [Defluviitaleaceae bacterium]|nr:BMP family ABC transporter substrate-binding protein [Defluviitaleaceae bacterium]